MSPALSTPHRLSPTISPDATSVPSRSARSGFGARRDRLVVPVRDHRADDHRERRRHREVDPDADGERRNAQLLQRAQRRVEQDEADADQRADADHLPLEVAADHALRQRRDERRLRRRQRIWRRHADVRRAGEAVRLGQQVEHGRNHRRAGATPTMSAICCRIGEAPTSWPVFRSCRLSFEIVAHAKTIAVTKSANATSGRARGLRRRDTRHDQRRRRRSRSTECRRRRSGCSTRR